MPAQSKLAGGVAKKSDEFDISLIFDPTQAVLPALCLAPVLWFNQSEIGKRFYAETFKKFANDPTGLARYLGFGVTKQVALPAFIGELGISSLCSNIRP
jgi:hypothetical protein